MAQINAGRVRFVSRGEYNSSTQYYTFDLVNYNGSSYYAKENTFGNLPTNTTYWQLVAEKGNTGSTGEKGDTGNGIATFTKTSTSGLVDTYTITYTNGSTTTLNVTNGKGIVSISKVSTEGNVDTYRITYNDGTTFDYEIENGSVTQTQFDDLEDRVSDVEGNQIKDTKEGTTIDLDDAYNCRLRGLEVHKETTQETTTGKNLFNGNNVTTTNSTNWTISFENNILSITHNNAYTTGTPELDLGVLPAGTYVISGTLQERIGLNANGSYVRLLSSCSTFEANGVDSYVFTFGVDANQTYTYSNVQLEQNSSATDYEPYTGGIASPNPLFPSKVKVVEGYRNLFDKDNNYNHLGLWNTDDGILSNITDGSNQNIIGAYCKVESGKAYSISRSKLTTRFVVAFTNGIPQENGQAYIYHRDDSVLKMENITIPNGYDCIFLYLSNTGDDVSDLKLQITEGTEEKPYVPYGSNYILFDDVGKNLFDKDNVRNGYRLGADGTYYAESGYSASGIINVVPNTNYYRNKPINIMAPICTYDKNQNFIARITSGNTFTTPSNCYYVRIAVLNSDLDTCQLEKGTTSTSYKPYQHQSIPLPLNNNFLAEKGNYVDKYIIDESTWKQYLYKRWGRIVFDGSENLQERINSNNVKQFFVATSASNITSATQICNYFKKYNQSLWNWGVIGEFAILTNSKQFIAGVSNDLTLDDFKEKIAENNLICYYVLATPKLIELPTTNIKLFNGVNHLSNSEDANMKITYVKDINMVLGSLVNRIEALENAS